MNTIDTITTSTTNNNNNNALGDGRLAPAGKISDANHMN